MIRYEHDTKRGRTTAVFRGNRRVPVQCSRARAYPGLPGDAPETLSVYELIRARLDGRVGRVADLGCGAGVGTEHLRARGFSVVGYDAAAEAVEFARGLNPECAFELGDIGQVPLSGFDALVCVDVLGLVDDDTALLRSLAARAVHGTLLVGAVGVAEVGQQLKAPCRRAFSAEDLDAVLVRAGWSAPKFVGRAGDLMVFESARCDSLEAADALAAADRVADGGRCEPELLALNVALEGASEPSMVRELLLAIGELQLLRGHRDEAEGAFTSANAIAPTCARPFVSLGRVALKREAASDAEALFDHALGLDATNVTAWQALAGIFTRRGEALRALDCLECAASLAPSDVALGVERAGLLTDVNDHPGAAAALERLFDYGPGNATTHAFYGWLTASAGERRPQTDRRTAVTTGVYAAIRTPSDRALAS